MKRKLTRKSLDELALIMPVLSEDVQRRYVGGGDGSEDNPFTEEEYDSLINAGTWKGGYVESWGYIHGGDEVVITGNVSGSQSGVSGNNDNVWEDWDNDRGPQGGSGYWGDSGNYWGDTGNYFDYGYNTGVGGGSSGGGSSNNGGSGNKPVEPINPQQLINELIWKETQSTYINQATILYGIDLSDVKFKVYVGDEPNWANAWISGVGDERLVNLGDAFFKMSSNEQIRILIHEYFHIKEDVEWSKDVRNIEIKLPDPPEYIKEYVMDKYCGNDEVYYQDFLSYMTLRDPNYYNNEANAYIKEKELFPEIPLEASLERDYRIWHFTTMANIARKYY